MSYSATWSFNEPLTSYGSSFYNNCASLTDLGEFLAPSVKAGITGTYKAYDRADAFELTDTACADYTGAKMIDIAGVDVAYQMRKDALKTGLSDLEIKGAGEQLTHIRKSKVLKVLASMRRSHIKSILDTIRGGTTAIKKTYGGAVGTPIADLKKTIANFELVNGVLPNRLLISTAAWNIIETCDEVRDYIEHNNVKALTRKLLAKALGYDDMDANIDIRKCQIPVAKSKGAKNVDLLGSELILFYADSMPSTNDISAVKTLVAGGSYNLDVSSKYDDELDAEFHRCKIYSKIVLGAPSCMSRWVITEAAKQS